MDDILNPLLSDSDLKAPFINQVSDDDYYISSGSWNVDAPLIINGNLEMLREPNFI